MVISTWNVNSIRARLEHVLRYLEKQPVDVLCLQELKVRDEDFPIPAFADAGWNPLTAGQKTYNGVAILTRQTIGNACIGFPHLDADHPLNVQKRLLAASVGEVRVICAYFPNGEAVESDKFRYKLDWLGELKTYLEQSCCDFKHVCLVGDFNIAPEDRDVYDPDGWADSILCSQPEREALAALRGVGMEDCFRRHHSEAELYTWWDYRGGAFWKNRGLRIDHIWATRRLAELCTQCEVDLSPRKWKRPSDHAPVRATFTV